MEEGRMRDADTKRLGSRGNIPDPMAVFFMQPFFPPVRERAVRCVFSLCRKAKKKMTESEDEGLVLRALLHFLESWRDFRLPTSCLAGLLTIPTLDPFFLRCSSRQHLHPSLLR